MRRLVSLGALFVAVVLTLDMRASDRLPPVFRVDHPTIVAFFPITHKELNSTDSNEALADFQFYLAQVRTPLQQKGIDLHETYAETFRISRGGSMKVFRPKDRQNGYYFVAPGRPSHFEYGVMTDSDLIDSADQYFGTLKK